MLAEYVKGGFLNHTKHQVVLLRVKLMIVRT